MVHITATRLEEFMQAELNYFAKQAAVRDHKPLKLQDWVGIWSSPQRVADFVYEELPLRFAMRIKHIEHYEAWNAIPELVALHDMHSKSFRELRLAEGGGDPEFGAVLERIRHRHKNITPLFGEAMRKVYLAQGSQPSTADEEPPAPDMDQWSDKFLTNRISTEILMSHCLACVETVKGVDRRKVGIVDTRCDPGAICVSVVEDVQESLGQSGLRCVIEVEQPTEPVLFCHLPRYIYYILKELVKNSARATIEAAKDSKDLAQRPIRITVCSNDSQIVIRISDRGGGMPSDAGDPSYVPGAGSGGQRGVGGDLSKTSATGDRQEMGPAMWSHLKAKRTDPEATGSLVNTVADRNLPLTAVTDDRRRWSKTEYSGWSRWGVHATQSPLSGRGGRGMGLLMSRLYAMYLGGNLDILVMPTVGVDAFLVLRRLEALPEVRVGAHAVDDHLGEYYNDDAMP